MSLYPSPTGVMVGMDLAYNLVVGVRQLVPRHEASHPAGVGKDHEGESGLSRPARAHSQRSSTLLIRADGAVLEQPELLGAVLEPDHLVR